MRYRPAELSDHDRVVELWVDLAGEMLDHGSRIDPAGSLGVIESHLAERIADGRVIVAEDGGSIEGLAVHSRREDPLVRTAAVGVIEFLYVVPARRGRGVGSALLERAEAALEADVDVVELEVLADNDAAIAFYEDRGYRPDRRTVVKDIDDDPESP